LNSDWVLNFERSAKSIVPRGPRESRLECSLVTSSSRLTQALGIMNGNTLNDSAIGAYKVNSLSIGANADPMEGTVTWDPARSIWNGGIQADARASRRLT
jgi:hypothetical protein